VGIFIDSGFFVAFHNSKDYNNRRALELMREIVAGRLGSAYTSDYIFDEAVTVALVRTGRTEIALNIGRMILGEITRPFLIIIRVNNESFSEAWKLFSRYAERGLGFTDCTSIALMRMSGINSIVSFDADFDGIVPRIS